MADSVIRKACDRCHSQKLSCKRVGEEACERCIRLHTECKSSPSLRYKKQQHQHQQQQQQQQQQQHHHHNLLLLHAQHQQQQQQQEQHQHQHQHQHHNQHHNQHHHNQHQHHHQQQQQLQLQLQIHHSQSQHNSLANSQPQTQAQAHPIHIPVVSSKPPNGRRSPKRRRTSSELSLGLKGQGLPILVQTEEARLDDPCVSSIAEGSLDQTDFNFAQLDQLGFFPPSAHGPLAQGKGTVTGAVEGFHPVPSFPEQWEHSLNQATERFHTTNQATLPQTTAVDGNQFPSVLSLSARRTGEHSRSIIHKRRQSRLRNKSKQIALSQVFKAPAKKEAPAAIHWMAQLSEINSRLLDLASVLPQPATAQSNMQVYGRPDDKTFPPQGFPVDEMFQLTRRVADLLDRLCGKKGSTPPRMDSSDPGNSMLVLSTYVRLLDMYQKVFSLVRMELLHADVEATFRCWRLPDVQVGSFAVDPIPPLQMSLTIQLAEEFLARLRAATATLDPALANGPGPKTGGGSGGEMEDCGNGKSMFSDVVDISYLAVKAKEESLGEHLAELRDEIQAVLDS